MKLGSEIEKERKKIYDLAITAIEKNNLFFIADIVAWMPCGCTKFYELFPAKSEGSETFKELLDRNKVKTKSAIRSKLFKSNKASELLALYRLIATVDEHRLLNQSYIDHTNDGDKFDGVGSVNLSINNKEISLKKK